LGGDRLQREELHIKMRRGGTVSHQAKKNRDYADQFGGEIEGGICGGTSLGVQFKKTLSIDPQNLEKKRSNAVGERRTIQPNQTLRMSKRGGAKGTKGGKSTRGGLATSPKDSIRKKWGDIAPGRQKKSIHAGTTPP